MGWGLRLRRHKKTLKDHNPDPKITIYDARVKLNIYITKTSSNC